MKGFFNLLYSYCLLRADGQCSFSMRPCGFVPGTQPWEDEQCRALVKLLHPRVGLCKVQPCPWDVLSLQNKSTE